MLRRRFRRVGTRQRERGNVLEMRGMQRSENPGGVDDGADVGAVCTAAGHGGVAELVHQVESRAGGQLVHQRLRIGVVEHHAFGVLREAGGLLVDGLSEAALVDLDAQAAGGHLGARLQRCGIVLRGDLTSAR